MSQVGIEERLARRLVLAARSGGRRAIAELIESVFVAELLAPSSKLWVVSPWLSDVAVLDNTIGGYTSLVPALPRSRIPLSSILAELVRRGTSLRIVTQPGEGKSLVRALLSKCATSDDGGRVAHVERQDLHVKAIVTGKCVIRGSMNFTYAGRDFWAELESYSTESAEVAELQFEFADKYGSAP